MPGWSIAPLFVILVSQVVVLGFHSEANSQPALPTFPGLEAYAPSLILRQTGCQMEPEGASVDRMFWLIKREQR
jgi:hypothetical protein